MGGCRCTFRNCTVRSDGKTHMFHYPVFEKIRCHQWLVNANRLEFLNLKVSQLKNRVVCQHHFKDECFMNYKKEKLALGAVPTENGPFCDSSALPQMPDSIKNYSLILEDIENDCITFSEKKANFPVKYADFLTNCEDFDDGLNINLKPENENVNHGALNPITDKKPYPFTQSFNRSVIIPAFQMKKTDTTQNQVHPTLIVPPFVESIDENKLICKIENGIKRPHIINNSFTNDNKNVCALEMKQTKSEPKIKIISEKKINEPIKIRGKLTSLSPTKTLKPIDKFSTISVTCEHVTDAPQELPRAQLCNGFPHNVPISNGFEVSVEYDSKQPKASSLQTHVEVPPITPFQGPQINQPMETSIIHSPSMVKKSQMKTKLTPDRKAAIENKRQFNMKLRNVIEESLEGKVNLGKDNKSKTESIVTPSKLKLTRKLSKRKLEKSDIQDKDHFEQQSLLSEQPYTLAFLEKRLSKMENILLNRIDQNSRQISELKFTVHNQAQEKKDTYVQTNESESSYKKFLYQEISQYLSPGTNSTLYEELFIDKYCPKDLRNLRKSKRRRS